MKNLTIKRQLSLAFGALVVLVLAVSVLALHGLSAADGRFAGYVSGPSEREHLASNVLASANRRAIGVRDMVLSKTPAERASAQAMALEGNAALQTSLAALKTAVAASADAGDRSRTLVDAIDRVEARYRPVAVAIVELAAAEKNEAAVTKMNVECRPLLASLLGSVREYIAYSKVESAGHVDESAAAYALQRLLLITISVSAAVIALGLGWWFTRYLMASLGTEPADLRLAVQRVAQGDLSPVAGAGTAPADSVLASIGTMQAQLVKLIGQVRRSADSIATASSEIAQGNSDLSGRTEQQAAALEETASSMEQLSSTVRTNAENARQANQFAQGASAVAIQGGEVVGEVVATMKGINDSSRRIADIISVIDGIAFQTNILALNAAVEAARAGEQGRGFAVVASEVRSLAGRSADAAKEIKGLISASVDRVAQGTVLVDQAGATMTQIVTSIGRVTDIMGEISAASSEQSAGVAQMGEAVSQMDKATQQNAALVEQSAAAAQGMQQQAQQLVHAVAAFRLAGSDGGAASAATTGRAPAASTAPTTAAAAPPGAPGVERRGADRAKNVVRPPFGAAAPRAPAASAPVRAAAAPVRTGTGTTDEWESF